MNEKETKCQTLYKEYKELEHKINIQAQKLEAGTISASNIPTPDVFLRKEAIRQELLSCRGVLNLSDEDWFEIENG